MKVIMLARGKGKTNKLLDIARDGGGYLVLNNRNEVDRVWRLAREKEYTINMPITHDEFIDRRYYARGIKEFYIDNVDMLLQRMSAVDVAAVTLTKEGNNG